MTEQEKALVMQGSVNSVEFFSVRDTLRFNGISVLNQKKDQYRQEFIQAILITILHCYFVFNVIYYGILMVSATPSTLPFLVLCIGIISFCGFESIRISKERVALAKEKVEDSKMYLQTIDHLEKIMDVRYADAELREKMVTWDYLLSELRLKD